MINRAFAIVFITEILLASCISDRICPEKEKTYNFQIEIQSLNGSGDYEEREAIDRLDAYVFNNKGQNAQHIPDLKMNQEGIIQLKISSIEINNIYFLANHPDIPDNEIVTEAELSSRVTSSTMETFDNLFMTSSFHASKSGNIREKLYFTRSVSRIDMDKGDNILMEIDSITIDNMADRTYLFPRPDHSIPGNVKFTTYTKKFMSVPTPKGAKTEKGIFYVYENGMNTANISIYGRYSGVQSKIVLTIPKIERNYLYTIVLKPVGQTIEGSIRIEEWQNGEDIQAGIGNTETT